MSARILAVANQKGGVGKTTTAINLAHCARDCRRKRVLLVDMDPQANLTSGVGLKGQAAPAGTVYHALTSDVDGSLAPFVMPTRIELCADARRPQPDRRRSRTRVAARPRATAAHACSTRSATRFDYIFIDTPPSLGLLTLNALVAADAVLIPLNCEYFALEGLADLVATLRRVRAALNPTLDIAGVLLTMYDERTNLGQQVAARHPRSSSRTVSTTPSSRGTSGSAKRRATACRRFSTTSKSRGAEAYLALAHEVARARRSPRPHRRRSHSHG